MSSPAEAPPLSPAAFMPRTRSESKRAWLVAASLVVGLAALFCLHRPSAEALVELWRDTGKTTYTHGFVIAALSAWLVVRHRARLAALALQPDPRVLLLLLPLAFAWLVAVRAGVELIHELLLLPILWLAIGAVAGIRFMRELTVPVGFLVFALPVWDQINGLLQSVTVVAVTFLLQVAGVPAFVDGNVVHLAVGVFEVEGGCSGLHFFIVGLTLATLYGELGNDRLRERVLFVAIAAALAMISNWLRVAIIVIAGHLTNMQHYLVRVEHYWFGWMMFALTMVAFLLIARRIAPPARAASPSPLEASAPGSRPLRWAIIGAICVCCAPLIEIARPVEAAALPDTRLPHDGGGWHRVAETFAWTPELAGVDRVERATFTDARGARVQVLAAEYAEQKQNKELVSYGNLLVPRAEGRIVASSALARGRELILASEKGRAVVRYVYIVGHYQTARDLVEQFAYGFAALRGPVVSAVVALRAECSGDDCAAARLTLEEFAQALGPELPGGKL